MEKIRQYLIDEKKITDEAELLKQTKLIYDCLDALTPCVVTNIKREHIDWHAHYIWDTGYGDTFRVIAREEGLEIMGQGGHYVIHYADGINGKLYPLAINLTEKE